MNIVLSEETQRLLEERMKKGGYATADEAVRDALQIAEDLDPADDRDEETLAAIKEGLAEADRGETMTVDEARDYFKARGILK